jgi:hypothetical protein
MALKRVREREELFFVLFIAVCYCFSKVHILKYYYTAVGDDASDIVPSNLPFDHEHESVV